MSEMKERPRLITAGYGQHRSQWVKILVDGALMHHMMLDRFMCRVSCNNN